MILIDDRAGSRDLVNFPPLNDPKVATLHRLDSADVCIAGNGPSGPELVGVEMKSIPDLVASTNNGRLQATQLKRMTADYDERWLLYYGEYRANRNGDLQVVRKSGWETYRMGRRSVSWSGFERFLLTLEAVGMHAKHVASVAEAAKWIAALDGWRAKEWSEHKSLRTFDRSRELGLMPGVSGDVLMRARMVAAIEKIGFERGVAAAQYFPSVPKMMSATVTEWAQVPGIGKVLGRVVYDALHREEAR